MDSELQVLKKIWENKEESYVKLISSQTGLGTDYVHYLGHCLLKKNQIKPIQGKRDWYKITAKGKKELESRHLIRSKIAKKAANTEKVIYYFPKKLSVPKLKVASRSGKKAKLAENNFQKASQAKKIKRSSRDNLIKAEEKKMNVWRSVAKAASFLKNVM